MADAAAALATAAAALVEADVEATAPADRMNAYEVIETALRRVPTAQHAILASLDRDVKDARVREALRFLLWKTGGQWLYVNFWNSLTYKGGNGLWQNGQVALREIRSHFPQGH